MPQDDPRERYSLIRRVRDSLAITEINRVDNAGDIRGPREGSRQLAKGTTTLPAIAIYYAVTLQYAA